MELERLALNQHGLEGLNGQAVQRGRAVEQHGMVVNHVFQYIPNLGLDALDDALGRLDVGGVACGDQLLHDEGLEQLQRHRLGQTALIHLQVGADDDNGTAGIVDTLTQQVLAEASLLTSEQVGKRLERAVAGAGDGAASAAVVDQGVDGFLEHTLFIAHDDIGRAQLQQALESVVAVDDAAVQVVQVTGGEAAAVQLHHGAQFRGNDGNGIHNHPGGMVAALAEGFDHFQALDRLDALLAGSILELVAQLLAHLIQIQLQQQLLDGLAAHLGDKGLVGAVDHGQVAVIVHGLAVLGLGQQLLAGQVGGAGVEHDVGREIEHLFQRTGRDIQQQRHLGRNGAEIPDVGNRRGQLDMAHALTAHLGAGDFNAALVADNTLVAHALVFAAVALPVLGRPKDAFAEQAVLFGLEGAVIDGFGLFDFTSGPLADLLRRRQTDLYRIKVVQFKQRGPLPSFRPIT